MLLQEPNVPDGVDVLALLKEKAAMTFFEGPVSVTSLVIHMAIGVILSMILQWHFRRFASTLSNKNSFSKVFPFILLTTLLIITVVKSSLALSLGLVGALSIVRFRTPIKEPEELAYLFICIAMGLGLGAEQAVPTLVGCSFLMVTAAIVGVARHRNDHKNLYLSITWDCDKKDSGSKLESLNKILAEYVIHNDLRRVDSRDDGLEACYLVELTSADELSKLIDRLHKDHDKIGVSFLDQSRMPSG